METNRRTTVKPARWILLPASLLLAIVFLAAGIGKLLGQSAFLLELSRVFVAGWLSILISHVLPWFEVCLGTCLLLGVIPQIAAGLAALLAAAFIFHNSWLIAHGLGYQPCSCLGVLGQITGGSLSTTGALYVDIALFALGVTIYFLAPAPLLSFRPWFFRQRRNARPDIAD